MDISEWDTKISRYAELRRQAIRQIKTEQEALSDAKNLRKATEEALAIIQALSVNLQKKAHVKITTIVSNCLLAIFQDEAYELEIKFEKKRNKTSARLIFIRNGQEFAPGNVGGGVVDVAAFALRIACLMISKPSVRKVVVTDEPFRFVSKQYALGVHDMLHLLARELKIQFILVTHNAELMSGTMVQSGSRPRQGSKRKVPGA